MRYQEYRPYHPLCQKYIECFWTISFTPQDEFRPADLVLPDSGVDWVFNLGDPYMRQQLKGDKVFFRSYRSQLVGQRTTAVHIKQSRETKLVVIRFKPFGLTAMGFKDIYSITDEVIDDNLLFGSLGQQIGDTVTSQKKIEEVLFEVEHILLSYLRDVVPAYLCDFWTAAQSTEQISRVKDICNYYGLSRSTVCRDFKKYIGLGPKKMLDLIRFKRTIQSMDRRENLTSSCYQNDYYDQAHMIHAFKQITDMSPKKFLNEGYILPKMFSLNQPVQLSPIEYR